MTHIAHRQAMLKKGIENIIKGRAALMGFAILWIIGFHYSFLFDTPIRPFFRNGYLGVDLFLMLSSFGLCFSFEKDRSATTFYRKRLLKIMPTWWFCLTILLAVNVLEGGNYPHSILQYLCYYSGVGWWFFHNEPFGIYYYEWYIPTLLLFYALFPLLYRQSNKRLAALMGALMIAGVLLSYYHINDRLFLSYFRPPVFIAGIFLYRIYRQEAMQTKAMTAVVCLLTIIGLAGIYYYTTYPMRNGALTAGLTKYSFMLALPALMALFAWAIRKIHLSGILAFIGTITLELYMLHIYNVPLKYVTMVIDNRNIAIAATTLLLIPIAWGISKFVAKVFPTRKAMDTKDRHIIQTQ